MSINTFDDTDNVAARVEQLNRASQRRVVEPDLEISGSLSNQQVIPDELLSTSGLDVDLSAAQRATLSREEVASVARFGILFEAVLMSGFAYRLALSSDITDPRFTYALHEIGEETRHSRMFIRLVNELAPSQRDPFNGRLAAVVRSRTIPLLMRRPATLDAFVLAGEEITDLLQKLAAEHPGTDDYVRAVSRYHRLEEARHLAYARATVGEHYRHATWTDRFAVRWVVPVAIGVMFDTIVQPFVYPTVGLPALQTWLRVRRQPARIALRQRCAQAVLQALINAEVFEVDRIPPLWRYVSSIDGTEHPRRRTRPPGGVVTASIAQLATSVWMLTRSTCQSALTATRSGTIRVPSIGFTTGRT
jgi:hypothetical protein